MQEARYWFPRPCQTIVTNGPRAVAELGNPLTDALLIRSGRDYDGTTVF